MILYNTLSGKKEKLVKPKNKPLKLFVCGPTVYGDIHIGNARVFLFFDILVRYLRSRGYKVFSLQNITDVDDKIIKRAEEEKLSSSALAKKYEKTYDRDVKNLKINSVDKYAKATDHIPQIVAQIQTLIKKGRAYKIEGNGYYFDISVFPDYGRLSRRTVLDAEDAVSRIDENVHKKNKGDFALWKFSKPDEPYWNTALGKGRPGWHIEDTAISEYYFGVQYDLHGGAVELKFPHHEAEIAQQESASGKKPFVKIWIHVGILTINGKKMSKSLGNLITVNDFLKKFSHEVLRMLILNHHYRSPIDYSEELAVSSANGLRTIGDFLNKLRMIRKRKGKNEKRNFTVKKYEKEFYRALDDDFNTPKALAAIFALINDSQKNIWKFSASVAQILAEFIEEKFKIFGLTFPQEKIPIKIKALTGQREKLRLCGSFQEADALRKTILTLGYLIEDTPLGPLIGRQYIK